MRGWVRQRRRQRSVTGPTPTAHRSSGWPSGLAHILPWRHSNPGPPPAAPASPSIPALTQVRIYTHSAGAMVALATHAVHPWDLSGGLVSISFLCPSLHCTPFLITYILVLQLMLLTPFSVPCQIPKVGWMCRWMASWLTGKRDSFFQKDLLETRH